MADIWEILYQKARAVQKPRSISSFVEAGGVAAALLTDNGNIYTGICIDTACSLGMCAERNAIANMLTNGENEITKLVAVMPDGKVGMPCGACRELMLQLSSNSGKIEILSDYPEKIIITLSDLCPNWWGNNRF